MNSKIFCPIVGSKKIKGILLPTSPLLDTLVWEPSSNGQFTVKSTIWLSHGLEPNLEKWYFHWICKIDTPPKLQISLWKICHDNLPIRDIVTTRRIIPFSNCSLCNFQHETIEHLFFHCQNLMIYGVTH